MFNDRGLINIIEVLKKEYNYQYTTLSDLYKQDFIELEGNGVDALFWLKYKDDKYLFKPINNFEYNVWGEIISEEIAEDIGYQCAEYRIAVLGDMKGVLSKSFLNKNERLIMGSELIQEYLRKTNDISLKHRIDDLLRGKFLDHFNKMKLIFKNMNNYTDISKIIKSSSKIDENKKRNFDKNMKDRLFFDILTMQGDDHPNNWAIVKTSTGYRISELYDNATSFGINYPYMEYIVTDFKSEFLNYRFHNDIERLRHFSNVPLVFSYNSSDKTEPPRIVLEEFLNNLTDGEVSEYNKIINKFDIDYLDKLITSAEEKNGYKMDNELRFYILNLFDLNIKDLKDIFEKRVVKDEQTRKY